MSYALGGDHLPFFDAPFLPGDRTTPIGAGTRRLYAAILERSLADVAGEVGDGDGKGPHRSARIRRDAERWFASDDTIWPVAFVSICQALHLDPDRIRRAVAARSIGRPPVRRVKPAA